MMPRTKILFLIGTALVLFMACTAWLFVADSRKEALPVLGEVSDFQLINQAGEAFSLNDLKDKVWVADFIFTTCGGICPVMTKNMASLHRSYHMMGDVQFVSISVNPEQDGPQELSAYAEKYGADPEQWHFLTGARNEIRRLAVDGFKVGSAEDPVFHSAYFILVDRMGRIRGYYDGTENDGIQTLFKDLARVARE